MQQINAKKIIFDKPKISTKSNEVFLKFNILTCNSTSTFCRRRRRMWETQLSPRQRPSAAASTSAMAAWPRTRGSIRTESCNLRSSKLPQTKNWKMKNLFFENWLVLLENWFSNSKNGFPLKSVFKNDFLIFEIANKLLTEKPKTKAPFGKIVFCRQLKCGF